MSRLVVVVMAVAVGCVRPSTFECGDVLCSEGTSCVAALGQCVSTDALVACEGLVEGAACQASGAVGTCLGGICIPLQCGDGVVSAPEQCDGANVLGHTCASLGFYDDGQVACAPDCTFDVSACTGTCGDGAVQGFEACDGATTLTCLDLGFYEDGPVSCTPLCTVDASGCRAYCGDHVLNGPETCDGADPQLQCVAFGFDYGATACTASCSSSLAKCGRLGWHLDPIVPELATLGAITVIDGWTYLPGLGLVYRFNDVTSSYTTVSTTGGVASVWGPSATELFVVTTAGKVLRGDGTTWTEVADAGVALSSVHGLSSTAVWAVGAGGTIYYFDGATWASVNDAGVTAKLNAVFAISPTDVIAVGAGGTILRFDGSTWSDASPGGVTAELTQVWGAAGDDLYVGGLGVLLHWDGVWAPVALPLAPSNKVAVTGLRGDHVFAAQTDVTSREHLWHYDGRSWMELEGTGEGVAVQGLAVTPSGQLVLGASVGFVTQSVWRYHSAGLGVQRPPSIPRINAMWSPHRDFVVAVGGFSSFTSSSRALLVFKGGAWTMTTQPSGTYQDVWGLDDSTIVAVSSLNTAIRYDGTAWQPSETLPAPLSTAFGVWGTSATDVFVGGGGGIAHRDAVGWAMQQVPAGTASIADLWGTSASSVYAVGAGGVILHYDGSAWTAMASGTQAALNGVWGTSDSDVYALAANQLLHYDGVTWSPVDTGSSLTYVAISGSRPDDVFILTSGNGLLHFDGDRWAPVDQGVKPTDATASALFADEAQWLYAGEAFLGSSEPAVFRQYLRTGPGGLGK